MTEQEVIDQAEIVKTRIAEVLHDEEADLRTGMTVLLSMFLTIAIEMCGIKPMQVVTIVSQAINQAQEREGGTEWLN